MALSGKLLASIQDGDVMENFLPSRIDPANLDMDALAKLAQAGGMDASLATKAVDASRILLNRWIPSKPVNTHSDFVPWNIIVFNDSVALVDVINYHLSDPEEDLALMYTALASLGKMRKLRKRITLLRNEFLDGYGRKSEPTRWKFWRIRSLLYLCSWLRHQAGASFASRFVAAKIRKYYEEDMQKILAESET